MTVKQLFEAVEISGRLMALKQDTDCFCHVEAGRIQLRGGDFEGLFELEDCKQTWDGDVARYSFSIAGVEVFALFGEDGAPL